MKIGSVLWMALLVFALQAPATAYSAKAPQQERKVLVRDGLVNFQGRQTSMLQVLNEICTAANLELFVFDPVEDREVNVDFREKPLKSAIESLLKGLSYSVVYPRSKQHSGVRFVAVSPSKIQQQPGLPDPSTGLAVAGRSAAAQHSSPARVLDEREGTQPGMAGRASLPPDAEKARKEATPYSGGLNSNTPDSGNRSAESRAMPGTSPGSSSTPPTTTRQNPQGQGIVPRQVTPEERLRSLIATYEERIASGQSDREYKKAVRISGGAYQVTHDRDRIQAWKEALERHSGR